MENKDDKKIKKEDSVKKEKQVFKGTKKNFRKGKKQREKPEFEQQLVDLARVTRITKAGKQLTFRALVVLGDKKGKVGFAVEKGSDVSIAVSKAVARAKKSIINVEMVKGTIPHEVREKFKGAQVMIKPAPQGAGVKAGGAVRTVLDLAGVSNVVAKILGSANKINNVRCVYQALKSLRKPQKIKKTKELKNEKIKKHKDKE